MITNKNFCTILISEFKLEIHGMKNRIFKFLFITLIIATSSVSYSQSNWTKIYETTNPRRNSPTNGEIVYVSGFGKTGGAASSYSGTFAIVRHIASGEEITANRISAGQYQFTITTNPEYQILDGYIGGVLTNVHIPNVVLQTVLRPATNGRMSN
jgi:hypothetical protein